MALPHVFATLPGGNVAASFLDDNFNAVRLSVNVFEFLSGAQITDVQARTHLIDLTTTIQGAITSAAVGGYDLSFPNGDYLTSAPLNVNAGMRLIGFGAQPYIGAPQGTGQRGNGTWFIFNHSGKGIWVAQPSAGNPASGIELRNFGTFRLTQTLPSAGAYVPAAFDYDIYCDNVDILIDNVMLLNATAGVYFTDEALNGYGRLDINRLRGEVFNDMIHINAAFDVCKIANVQRWPFWTAASAFMVQVQTYANANANCIFTARSDSPMYNNIFAFNVNAGIRIAQNALGNTTYLQATNCNFDNAIYGIYVDSTCTNGCLAQFDNLVILAPTTAYITGSNNIRVDSNHAQLDFGKCEFRQAQQNCVQINGANNRVNFGATFQGVFYNQSAGAFAAVQLNGTLNNCVFGIYPIIDVGELLTVGTLTGTGTTGTYTGITFTGSVTGSAAVATVTVTAGSVTAVTITTAGSGYATTDTLSFTIPGGSGTCKPATVSTITGRYGGNGASGNHFWLDEWFPYTPTVTSSAGTITTVGALNCFYKMVASTVTVNYDITITTNGTGSGVIDVTLPPTPTSINVTAAGSGRETAVAGKMLQSYFPATGPSQTFFQIVNYDNTYPASNGSRFIGTQTFETQGLFAIP